MPHNDLPHFELRSGSVDALLFVVKSVDIEALQSELARRIEATPDFFDNDAIAVDVRRLQDDAALSWPALVELLHSFQMRTIGFVARAAQRPALEASGMVLLESPERRVAPRDAPDALDPPAAAAPVTRPHEPEAGAPSTLIDRPLRSGQRIYAPGDLIVLGQVSNGAEIIAAGSIHVYAPLRGRALAGALGRDDARIFCTCMEPELLSIAGIYRTAEQALPDDLLGKPVHVRLSAGKLLVEALKLK